MASFKDLFGIAASQIQKTSVLTPFLSKGLIQSLGVEHLNRGRLYSAGQADHFTFIRTQIGASCVGDAVLYLEETSCENLILIGACGAVQETSSLKIGSLVVPSQCYNYESFSKLIKNEIKRPESCYADQILVKEFFRNSDRHSVLNVHCASFGSIKLENEYMEDLKEKGIDVVDMECCSFLNAAKHIKRQAMALFYVTDILSVKPLFSSLSSQEQSQIRGAQDRLVAVLLQFLVGRNHLK